MTTVDTATAARSASLEAKHKLLTWRTIGHQSALRRFALAITALTVAGHGFLGFEQSIAQPIVALITAYSLQILLEYLFARSTNSTPRFVGGFGRLVDFLLPAHIAALAVAMLLYFNDRLWIVAFATAVAIGSKYILRVPTPNGSRHFLNPSNLAITVTFLLFPSVGIIMPWQWTTEISGAADWAFPVIVFILGSLLHLKYAARIWVVISFLVAFVIQGLIRGAFDDVNVFNALAPATGVAPAIFTFYMAPDPATSPSSKSGQILYGSSIAFVYMILMFLHVVFALFYALTMVCTVRGIWMAWQAMVAKRSEPDHDQISQTALQSSGTS